jgi:hypothetical protein
MIADYSLLLLLIGFGLLTVRNLLAASGEHREGRDSTSEGVPCRRHDWVRCVSGNLVCRVCGKIPG